MQSGAYRTKGGKRSKYSRSAKYQVKLAKYQVKLGQGQKERDSGAKGAQILPSWCAWGALLCARERPLGATSPAFGMADDVDVCADPKKVTKAMCNAAVKAVGYGGTSTGSWVHSPGCFCVVKKKS